MRRLANIITAAATAAAAFVQVSSAQPTPPSNSTYSSTISYHVPEESRPAFEAWMKDKYRRVAEQVMKDDPAMQAVILSRVIYGGTVAPEADYYLSTFSQGIPKPRTAQQNQAAQKLFGKPYADFIKESHPLRKRLGQTLSRQWTTLQPVTAVAEGDVVIIDRKKITPGRMTDYAQLEQQYQPLRAAQIKAGKMKSWGMWSQVLPGGADRDFDTYTAHVVSSLEQGLTWNQGSAAMAAQLSPPLNLTGLVMRARDMTNTVRQEARVVVMVVRRQP